MVIDGTFMKLSNYQKQKPASQWLLMTLILLVWGILPECSPALAKEKPGYQDIYLTEDRVCRSCTWAWEQKNLVRLTNREGHATLVYPAEIIGVDRHPIIRKLTLKSLQGIGLPGPIIVPAAFDDANDYVCKYCKELGK